MSARSLAERPRLVIIGAGGHGRVVLDVARRQGQTEIVGFLDDRYMAGKPEFVNGCPILGDCSFDDLAPDLADVFAVAIGDNEVRERRYVEASSRNLTPFSIADPTAVLSEVAHIGQGVQALPGVIVNAGASIGDNVILNTGSTADHDSVVGDHCLIGLGASIGGQAQIGARSVVGIGAVILPRVKIGPSVIVAAGAVVSGDLPPYVMAAGTPARVVLGPA